MNLNERINWTTPVLVRSKTSETGFLWERKWIIPDDLRQEFISFWKQNLSSMVGRGFSFIENFSGKSILFERALNVNGFSAIGNKTNREVKNIDDVSVLSTTGLKKISYTLKDDSGLRPWQKDVVPQLVAAINEWGGAIDGSEMGVGKSYSAVAVAREIGLKIGVVCPKAVIQQWKTVITSHFKLSYEFVINYEQLKSGKHEKIAVWERIDKLSKRKRFKWTVDKNTLIIFDEAHKLKTGGSQNSEMATSAKAARYKILCCTGTVATNPLELKTIGYIIGLYKPGKWLTFMREMECVGGRSGHEFSGNPKILQYLRNELYLKRGARLTKDTIPNFPESEIICEPYTVEEDVAGKINNVYSQLEASLGALDAKAISDIEYESSALTMQLRARQKCELLKVPLLVDLATDALEEGNSVAIFVNFSETLITLSKQLKTNCIVWGENTADERTKYLEDFQSNKTNIILINIAAGGTGVNLHDIHGGHPRTALISPSHEPMHMKQALGRVWRDGAKTKSIQRIVFAGGTIEEKVCASLKIKINNMDLINDGDLDPFGIKFKRKK